MNYPFGVWDAFLTDHAQTRPTKPRTAGVTMVMDKGLGVRDFEDFLEIAGDWIDFIKLAFGTIAVTPPHVLEQKLKLARQHHIHLYPGGTFFEIAFARGQADSYLQTLKELGFSWVEISEGTVELSLSDRAKWTESARSLGFSVITEIGKKAAGSAPSIPYMASTWQQDMYHGASYVIMEGRENGTNIGIFDREGAIRTHYLNEILEYVDSNTIIWEAPHKDQQLQLLQIIGPTANFGNIPPHEALALECLRRGLRSDSFSLCHRPGSRA
jgi:phosphosulfolactate synthase